MSTQAERKEYKREIRAFMRSHYTDERLAQLLAHAQDGKLAYDSCCCFVGIPQATHALASSGQRIGELHYGGHRRSKAEHAFLMLGKDGSDESARRIIIPMIRVEMRRREIERAHGIAPTSVELGPAEVIAVEDAMERARR